MDNYYIVNNLKERFNLAIKDTSLNHCFFMTRNENGKIVVTISMTIKDENEYPVVIKKEYTDIQELEEFIDTLEKIKIIAWNPKYQVQLIPTNTEFSIYINGELVKQNTLTNYMNYTKSDIRSEIRDVFIRIEDESRKAGYLYHQSNNKQIFIDLYKKLLKDFQSKQSLSEIESRLKGYWATPITSEIYEINWNIVIEILEEYENAIANKDKNGEINAQNRLLEQYNKIIDAVKSGISISSNDYELSSNLTASQLQMALNFLKKLSNILDEMTLESASILNAKNEQIEQLKDALSHKKKEAINKIASIRITEEETSKIYSPIINQSLISNPYSQYNKGNFNFEMDKTAKVFKDIQRQQLEKLTSEERDALIYYKSSMYRPINQTIAFLRKNGTSLSEVEKDESLYTELIEIISKCYDIFIKNKEESERMSVYDRFMNRNQQNPHSVERLFGKYPNKTPSRTEYIQIVLSSIPLLESALNKIQTTEDIVVYRGVNNRHPSLEGDGRLLSTTISLRKASDFLSSEDRKTKDKPVFSDIYQIVIPKGSSVIAFTDDLFTDRYEEGRIFNEEQQEILIDPINFDFQNTYINTRTIGDDVITRINCKAIPKERTLEKFPNRTM